MRKILKVAQREYLETVKSKAFIISLLFAPAIFIGVIFFTSRMVDTSDDSRPPVKIMITDFSEQLLNDLTGEVAKHNETHPQQRIILSTLATSQNLEETEKEGKEKLRSGQADARRREDPGERRDLPTADRQRARRERDCTREDRGRGRNRPGD